MAARYATQSAAGRFLLAGAALVVLAGAHPLAAQQQPLLRFGVAGGVIVPTSDARSALKQGVHAQAFVLVNLLPGLPLRLNLGYQKFNIKQALAGAVTGTESTSADGEAGTSNILAGVAGTQIDLLRGPIRPYIMAGVGGFDITTTMNALSAGGTASTSQSSLKFGVDGGAGLAIKLGRLSAFVEGRIQNIYTQNGLANLKNIQAVPVSFGLLF